MNIVKVGTRRNIPVEVTERMRDLVAAAVQYPEYGVNARIWPVYISVECPQPHCRAAAGDRCLNPQGHPMGEKVHRVRISRAVQVFDALVAEAQK